MKTRTLFLALILALLAIWYFASRSNATVQRDRPNDPWVFRSVLDKQPRMITFALNDKLWVSYSTDSCALYRHGRAALISRERCTTCATAPSP